MVRSRTETHYSAFRNPEARHEAKSVSAGKRGWDGGAAIRASSTSGSGGQAWSSQVASLDEVPEVERAIEIAEHYHSSTGTLTFAESSETAGRDRGPHGRRLTRRLPADRADASVAAMAVRPCA